MRCRQTKSLSKVCASILLVAAITAAAVAIDADALRVKPLYRTKGKEAREPMTRSKKQ